MRLIPVALCLLPLLAACNAPGSSDLLPDANLVAAEADDEQGAAVAAGGGSALPGKGENYADARSVLISAGWQPFRGECIGGGTSQSLCADFPEVQDCSGTGAGYCAMRFARRDECLTLVTTGGPPQRGGGETRIDGVERQERSCAAIAAQAAATDRAAEAGEGLASLTAATKGLCARLEQEGVARAVVIDNFIPYYPPVLQTEGKVEAASLTSTQLRDAVRQLTCGAGLSGFGPDVPEAALPLFASRRHGAAALAVLRRLGNEGSPVQREAARGFLEQMLSYLGNQDGNG